MPGFISVHELELFQMLCSLESPLDFVEHWRDVSWLYLVDYLAHAGVARDRTHAKKRMHVLLFCAPFCSFHELEHRWILEHHHREYLQQLTASET